MKKASCIIQVKDLKTYFKVKRNYYVKAVDGVSFQVNSGETLGLVGESGCGKTTVARSIMRLVKPDGGRVIFENVNLLDVSGSDLRKLRRNIQMVFQDPYSSLNPRKTVLQTVAEPLITHTRMDKTGIKNRVRELIKQVGLAEDHIYRYPHEFSGGQRQRIGVARAVALNPKIIILDEPTSALDVSVQAQILNLLSDLQTELSLSYLLISHDLSVVRHMCDRIAVMYLGKIVEIGPTETIYNNVAHPYTRALLSANPQPDPDNRVKEIILEGDVPKPTEIPSGCRFRTRCPQAEPICSEVEPELKNLDCDQGHLVRCHFK